jgi:hypothetical protein
MKPRAPVIALPTCVKCDLPPMHGCKTCYLHWQEARGWNEATGEYLEPFEAGDDDQQHWSDESEAIK